MKSKKRKTVEFNIGIFVVAIAITVIAITMLKYQVEGEKDMPYVLKQMVLISTANGTNTSTDEYKWNMDFYTKIKKFVEKNPKKYKLIKEILQSNIEKLPYSYHELDYMLSSYRELLQTIYLKKMEDDEDELRKRIHNECYKKLYIKR